MGTRETGNWVAHVDIFVDPDESETKQAASFAAITKLLLDKQITIQDVVTTIGKYLTATDNSIRARGLLLLGDLLCKLPKIPLEDTTIHSLATFFTVKLADWHSVRGALTGSIALLRRSPQVGRMEESDVKDMAQSVLQYLHVQALGLADRLLSLELFECLVDVHGSSVSSLGGDLVYAVSAAIEEEKDPRCLLVAFHLVELLARLFPAPDGPFAQCTEDIFDIFSRYFPVSFTPPPNDTRGISREDLSDALLKVFTSTPLFAPFCIPLILEKLSSSLETAKLDSFRYLGLCALSFGRKSVSEHAGAIWKALKAELMSTADEHKDIKVHDAALLCLIRCVEASQKEVEESETKVTLDIVKLICEDECVEDLLRFVENDFSREAQGKTTVSDGNVLEDRVKPENEILSKRANEQTRGTGQILAAVVKASPSSCHFVTNRILNRLVVAGGIPALGQIETPQIDGKVATCTDQLLNKGSISALGLEVMIQILEAAAKVAERRALLSTSSNTASTKLVAKKWLEPIFSVAPRLLMAFSQVTLDQVSASKHSKIGVAGLQALASFPAGYSPLTEGELQHLLSVLVETLMHDTNIADLKDGALDAILTTSNLEEKFGPLNENTDSIIVNVVCCKLLEAIQQAQTTAALKFPLQALASLAGTRQIARQAVLNGLRKTIALKFIELGSADDNALQTMAAILDCLSQEIIPFCGKGSTDQMTACDIVLDFWTACPSLSHTTNQISDEVLSSIMALNRVTVRSCPAVVQEQILSRATSVLLDLEISDTSVNTFMRQQDVKHDWTAYTTDKFIGERGWMVALVASDVLGLLPAVVFPGRHLLLNIFVNTSISEASVLKTSVAAQASASLINKWKPALPKSGGAEDTVDQAIREALDEVVMPIIDQHLKDRASSANVEDGSVCNKDTVVRAVYALSWIGKGLTMRGHARISDIAAALLALLESEGTRKVARMDAGVERAGSPNLDSAVAQAAAEGIGIIVKDNATCLDSVHNAVGGPLFKQRFFTSMLPPLQAAVQRAGNLPYRMWFFRAFGHLLSGTPRTAVLTEGQKVFPLVLEGLSTLCNHPEDSDLLLSTLLTLSLFLTDENYGRTIGAEFVPAMVKRLTNLVHYRPSLVIRETALQCLGAIVGLPFTRVFPEKPQVLKAINVALDDHKRRVRKEAVRCLRVWSAISS